jgi:hypothetical protein
MDRWPSGSTFPMNLYVFAVLSMISIYHIYNSLSKFLSFHYSNFPKEFSFLLYALCSLLYADDAFSRQREDSKMSKVED